MKTNFKLKIALAAALAGVFGGCATHRPEPLVIKELNSRFDLARNPGKAVVVGSIEVKGFGGVGIRVGRYAEITDTRSSRTGGIGFTSGKPFFLVMEPGEYAISAIYGRYGLLGAMGYASSSGNPRVSARFTVNEREVVYIGNLVCTMRKGYFDTAVTDVFDSARAALAEERPDLSQPLAKRLMVCPNP